MILNNILSKQKMLCCKNLNNSPDNIIKSDFNRHNNNNIIKSEFIRLNNKIKNLIIECGKRFKTEQHLLSAIVISGMDLMTAYINIYQDDHVTSYKKKLTRIAIACFWICQKFLDDDIICGDNLEKTTGVSYRYIEIEERNILVALDFKICPYMQGERPLIEK